MTYQMLITVKKAELLEKMQENRAKHREIFEDAIEGYRRAAVRELEDELKRVREGRRPGRISIYLDRPEDHTRDYDRVIGMLKMHRSDEFTLDEGTYARYVNDQWDWKDRWVKLSSTYSDRSVAAYGDPDE